MWLALIAVLYAVSIPWYRSPDAPLRLWGGIPDWVAVALLCYLGAAVANVLAWRATPIAEPRSETDADPAIPGTSEP